MEQRVNRTKASDQLITGREYLRVSRDRSGRLKSPQEQHADHERDAAARGVILGAPYREAAARSASKFGKRPRDDFQRLIKDLQRGAFGATELWMWAPSRGSRKTSEFALLLDLLEEHGIDVWVSSHNRLYRPGHWKDREDLMNDAVKAESFSGELSMAIRRGMRGSAEEGKPGGKAAFGYRRIYDPKTGALVSQEIVAEEKPIVEELFRRVDAGHAFSAIERDWRERGIVKRNGRPFTDGEIRQLCFKPVYAGLRILNDVQYEGNWPPLVDRAVWRRVQARKAAPVSAKGRPGGSRYLASYIVPCECGSPLNVRPATSGEGLDYRCKRKGCTRISTAKLDAYVGQVVFAYLGRPDVRDAILAASLTTPDLDVVRDRLAGLREELEDLYRDVRHGRVSRGLAAADEERILAAIEAAEQRERELSMPDTLTALLQSGLDDFPPDMPMGARRSVLRELFTPDRLGVPHLKPAKARWTPVHERIRWDRA